MCAQRFLIPSLLLLLLGGLAALPAVAADPVPTHYVLEQIVSGYDHNGKLSPYDAHADRTGGRILARIHYRHECVEDYAFTWKFNRDVRVLRAGDEIVVTASASVKAGSCSDRVPFMSVFGSNHHLQPKPLMKLQYPADQIGNYEIDGSTGRVKTKPGGSKAARLTVTKAGPQRIWFAVSTNGASSLPGQILEFVYIYVYKAQYGPIRQPRPSGEGPNPDDPFDDSDLGPPFDEPSTGIPDVPFGGGATEPWKDPRVQRCIDAWLAKAVGILNRRARDRAPWGVSPYGHLINKQVRSYSAPDGWASKYGSSKHNFVWKEWSQAHTNAMYGGELPALHTHCGGTAGGGSGRDGTVPGGNRVGQPVPGPVHAGTPPERPVDAPIRSGGSPTRTSNGLLIRGARVRFFEADNDKNGLGARTIATRFPTSLTRYVYWDLEIDVQPPAARKDFQVRAIWYRANGTVLNDTTTKTHALRGWTNVANYAGWGATNTGTWALGAYRVEFSVGGKRIAEGAFFITR